MSDTYNKKRLIVIDGNHLIHRAFYAIQNPLKTSSGEQTNAVYGFASMLLNIMDLEKPDFLAMTFDMKTPTFRHDMHDGYKATRTKAPDELYAQIPRIHQMVEAFHIPIFIKEGYEADDLMGTLAKRALEKGMETYLVTGDMDALQLIEPGVYVVFPHKGYKEPIIFNAQKVEEKYGIRPEQVVDFKALMGDSSDNIKGVEGIGPKRAAFLLAEYGTLDGIYEHLSQINGSLREKLEKGQDNAYFSRTLAKIVQDVPCDFNEREISIETLDFLALDRFFEEMEMRSLRGRLKKLTPPDKQVAKEQMSLFCDKVEDK